MSNKRCGQCYALRASILDHPLPHCKRRRLCKLVDPALILRYPGEPLASYQRRARSIEAGHVRAELSVRGRPLPKTGEELLASALEVHRVVFEAGDPSIAGRLRDRPGYFGGTGANRMEGAPHHQIHDLMMRFRLVEAPDEPKSAARWGADFLRRFFLIHPFVDGNGRIGRLLMTWYIESSGVLIVNEHDRGNRAYLRAIEYAHRHSSESGRFARLETDCLRYLTSYLQAQILDMSVLAELDLEDSLFDLDDDDFPDTIVDEDEDA